jgi:hypothetical protein
MSDDNEVRPSVVAGDRIYCQHPKLGAVSAEVSSVGQHGVTIPHESGKGHIGVKWAAILGHQKRRERKLKVLEEGEDGFIAENEEGKRVYVKGSMAEQGAEPDEEEGDQDDEAKPMRKALLLDIGPLSCGCSDHALDELHKAMSEDGIKEWAKHESPFIRDLIEMFTESGLLYSSTVRDELSAWIEGRRFRIESVGKAAPALKPGIWTEQQMGMVRTYLEAMPPDSFGLDDWALLVDYLAQRYMPEAMLTNEADMLVARAGMMGKIESYLQDLPGDAMNILASMPSTVDAVVHSFALSDAEASILKYGKLRACDAVTGVSEELRLSLRKIILAHQQKRLSGDPAASNMSLEQVLFERFGKFNRDWRMIAVTEAGEACNQGVIASLPPGSMVRRMEQYYAACPFCKRLDGRVYRVTTADDPKKDGTKDVWPGKTNIGRSASPNKRVGDELVPRMDFERWWAAAGTQHPHCRGRWEPLRRLRPGEDPAFERWMMEKAGVKFGMEY